MDRWLYGADLVSLGLFVAWCVFKAFDALEPPPGGFLGNNRRGRRRG